MRLSRTRPRVALTAAAAALAVLAVPAAQALPGAAGADVPGVLNILPAGSQGNLTLAQIAAAKAGQPTPANFHDQLDMYDALGTQGPGSLGADLSAYYKDASLGVRPTDVVSLVQPRAGTTIYRDHFGVPHVYGVTDADTEFGAGYAGISDRMFLTDVLRHTGAARLAEFLGATPANIAMDASQLRAADYTPAEAAAQITNLPQRFGAEGAALVARFDAFIAGMNQAQHDLCPAVAAPTCPGEYTALQQLPADYTRADIIYIASLVGGIFGKGGGGEFDNGAWLVKLQAKFGAVEGRKVFNDLRERNDPERPNTVPTSFSSGPVGPTDPASVALPDSGAATIPGTGAVASTTPAPSPPGVPGPPGAAVPARPSVVDGPLGAIQLDLTKRDMSNALLVDARHSASGHPTVVFGPQTGYFAPQLLSEVDLHGPHIDARGVSFAGTQGIVELGRGKDYAWSATSSDGDNVDVLAERLCNTDGSPASVSSTAYLDADRRCVPMTVIDHTENAVKPSAGGTALPQRFTLTDLRTRHGIVQLRTTAAGGVPVAYVTERSTYAHEFDSVVGFARMNDPTRTADPTSFSTAFDGVDYTFNWFYADARHIAWKQSGLLPVRPAGVDPDLPRFGDRQWDWTGFLSPSAHPHAVDPAQGYFANWNNAPAPGFAAADNQWGYGSIYRSRALADRIVARISNGHKVTRNGLVEAMIDAATVDVRAAYLLPQLLPALGQQPSLGRETALLAGWLSRGAHRMDRARTGHYDDQAAIALFDAWYPVLAPDVLRGTLGPLADQLPQRVDDHPNQGLGSSFNGVAWYGYVDKDLRAELGRGVSGSYSRHYCGGGSLSACRATLAGDLSAASAALQAAQKVTDPAALTYNEAADDIRARTVGVVGVRDLVWQNRPTFQQVVTFTANRSGPVAPVR